MSLNKLEDYVFITDLKTQNYYMVERDGTVWQPEPFPEAYFIPNRRNKIVFNWRKHIKGTSLWQWGEGFLPVLEVKDEYDIIELAVVNDSLQIRKNKNEMLIGDISSEDFSLKLAEKKKYWESFFAKGWQPPHNELFPDYAWKACFVQAISAFCGQHPKYGAGYYSRNYHDGFPPTIISLVNALLDYEHYFEAMNYLEYYLERFIMPDGTIDYYGPALSEYGMLLQLFYKISEIPNGKEWLKKNFHYGKKISRYLYRQRNNFIGSPSKNRLLSGVPEADTRDEIAVYTHINAWVWRGLSSWGEAAASINRIEAAAEAKREADDLYISLNNAIQCAGEKNGIVPFRLDKPAKIKSFLNDRNSAYANCRYYPEILQSMFLSEQKALDIIEARENLEGELEGMTLFHFGIAWPGLNTAEFCCNNWPIAAYAQALAELKEKERLKKLLTGHFNYHQSLDTFTAYENVDAKTTGIRHAFTDWCVPAQLVFPRVLKYYLQM
jgi:tetratricopeptide (TPR) repeat protein